MLSFPTDEGYLGAVSYPQLTLFTPPPNMNTPLPLHGRCLKTGMLACLTLAGIAPADELAVPRGTLHVDRDYVRTGTRSQLAWQIDHPAPVTSVVSVTPPNGIQPEKPLTMRVRLLGSAFKKPKINNGHGNNIDGVDSSNTHGSPGGAIDLSGDIDDEKRGITTYLPIEFLWCVNGGTWERLFYGYQNGVIPSKVLLETTVTNSDTVNFGGRGWRDGSWLGFYHTASTSQNLIVLKNGDRVPASIPALNGNTTESFLKPYVDVSSKTVKIGERDLILLMELGETDPRNPSFDLQDLVVLVTFE